MYDPQIDIQRCHLDITPRVEDPVIGPSLLSPAAVFTLLLLIEKDSV
jgi:hypothetical protein